MKRRARARRGEDGQLFARSHSLLNRAEPRCCCRPACSALESSAANITALPTLSRHVTHPDLVCRSSVAHLRGAPYISIMFQSEPWRRPIRTGGYVPARTTKAFFKHSSRRNTIRRSALAAKSNNADGHGYTFCEAAVAWTVSFLCLATVTVCRRTFSSKVRLRAERVVRRDIYLIHRNGAPRRHAASTSSAKWPKLCVVLLSTAWSTAGYVLDLSEHCTEAHSSGYWYVHGISHQ